MMTFMQSRTRAARRLRSALALFAACIAGACSGSSTPQSAPSSSAIDAGTGLLVIVQQRGELTVATDPNFKPQSYLDSAGNWSGFDVDVAREIARRLGVKAHIVSANFDDVVRGKWNQRWDINVGSVTITTDRAQRLWFTRPYYYDPAAFAVDAGSAIRSVKDLTGKRIGASSGSTYLAFLQGRIPTARVPAPKGIAIEQYAEDISALQDLARGNGMKLDAVLTALSEIRGAIASGLRVRVLQPPVFEESLAVDLDKSSPVDSRSLLWAIDPIIQQMRDDGTLRRLSMRYYGVDLTIRR